jgi:hypothetical protein
VLKTPDNTPAEDAGDRPVSKRMPLEPIGSALLLLVVLSLAWMILTAHAPALVRLASVEIEVGIVLGVLVTALVSVSAVALLHTRDR